MGSTVILKLILLHVFLSSSSSYYYYYIYHFHHYYYMYAFHSYYYYYYHHYYKFIIIITLLFFNIMKTINFKAEITAIVWCIAIIGKCDAIHPQSSWLYKCDAIHPQSSWLCSGVFLIDLCMLSTNLKVLSGANEYFRNYYAFFLPLFLCKLPSFRLQSPPRDITQGLWGCTASYLPY